MERLGKYMAEKLIFPYQAKAADCLLIFFYADLA